MLRIRIWKIIDAIENLVEVTWTSRFNRFTKYALLIPGVLVVGVLFAGVIYLADASFRTLDLNTYRLSEDRSLDNYRHIASRALFTTVFLRSLLAATVVTFITVTLAFPYAYLMVRTSSAYVRKFLLFSLFLPFFLGQVVRAYGWLILLGQEGVANTVLQLAGFPPMKLIYNYPAVIVGLVQYMLPFAVLMIAPAIVAITKELEQAAESLGASWTAVFRTVVLPLARPGIVGAVTVVFTITLTDFAMPAMMGGGSSDFAANLIHSAFFVISDTGLGAALSMVLVAMGSLFFALVLFFFGQRNVKARVGL